MKLSSISYFEIIIMKYKTGSHLKKKFNYTSCKLTTKHVHAFIKQVKFAGVLLSGDTTSPNVYLEALKIVERAIDFLFASRILD